MTRTPRASASDELRPIAAARFARDGFQATSLQQIADEAGYSKSSVLYHFASKEALLDALLEPTIDALAEVIDRADSIRGDADALNAEAEALRLRLLGLVGPVGDPSDEVRDALAPFFVLQSPDWTRRGELGLLDPEHLRERCPPLDGNDHAVDEPGQTRQPRPVGQSLQRGGEVGTCASVGQAAAELAGQLATGETAHALKGTHGALPRADGQGEQLCDSGELGKHARLALVGLPGEPLVACHDARASTTQGDDDEWHQ